jgi:dTDP-4-dehydrorhamnose reductase
MKKVLVTGAAGQLGRCFKEKAKNYPGLQFTFTTSEELDLSLFMVVENYFRRNRFDYCINCAAYTNVEQAEKEQEMAYLINAEAVNHLAKACLINDTTLIHFSTDYVFNGGKEEPYSEEEETDPLNVYGASKLMGENYIRQKMEKFFIFRTSWLYSDLGKNFFNTIRAKAEAGEALNITTSQTGTPTNAYDLAEYVLEIVSRESTKYGTYHYSNLGQATWFDFAREILSHLDAKTTLNENNDYQTLATRPAFSVLDKKKAQQNFETPILTWQESLKQLF